MTKRLAIFCDGTWNDLRAGSITNVARLAKCVADFDPTGVSQIVFYDEGVGVDSNIGKTIDKLVSWFGGAFGRGLDRKIEVAYRFVVMNFEPGDEIFVFGFSRGAYTARSLCGLIRKCGIVRRDCFDKIPDAMTHYRKTSHPKDAEMIEFRQRYSHALETGSEDAGWVSRMQKQEATENKTEAKEQGTSDSQPRQKAPVAQHLFMNRAPAGYRVNFLGVWDTVGSLGIPERFRFFSSFNKKYRFHDTRISGLIASVRHAVAIEERRRVLDAALMENIDDLNAEWARRTPWDVFDSSKPNYVPYHHRPYQQVWWPGDHGAVGSGNPELGLSSATLLWMAEGAMAAGLAFKADTSNELWNAVGKVNPMANWRIHKNGKPMQPGETEFLGDVGGYITRRGPTRLDEIGITAKLRWCADPTWRPENLDVLKLGPCPVPKISGPPSNFPPLPANRPPSPASYP